MLSLARATPLGLRAAEKPFAEPVEHAGCPQPGRGNEQGTNREDRLAREAGQRPRRGYHAEKRDNHQPGEEEHLNRRPAVLESEEDGSRRDDGDTAPGRQIGRDEQPHDDGNRDQNRQFADVLEHARCRGTRRNPRVYVSCLLPTSSARPGSHDRTLGRPCATRSSKRIAPRKGARASARRRTRPVHAK